MKILFLSISCLSILSGVSFASTPVLVNARAYDATACQYYTATYADFDISYPASNVPKDAKVLVHYAFHEKNSNLFWQAGGVAATVKNSSNYFETSLELIQVGARGGAFFDAIEYVFEIIYSNGTRVFDNGQKGAYGHFASPVPASTCKPDAFISTRVKAVTAADSSEAK